MRGAALIVEWWKVRHSPVVLTATALIGVLLPAMGLGFYRVGISGGNGLLADKASAFLTGEGWEGYLGLVDQVAAVALLLGAGIVVAWAFGREHVERTFPSLFALPVSLRAVALAKFTVMAVWVIALAVAVTAMAVVLGLMGGVGPLTFEVVPELAKLLAVTSSSGVLALTLGWVASIGRGYLPAIGALIVIIAAAQVAVLFGTGGWFPYAIPGLIAVAGSEGAPQLSPYQYALVPGIVVAATWLTLRWWATAEVS